MQEGDIEFRDGDWMVLQGGQWLPLIEVDPEIYYLVVSGNIPGAGSVGSGSAPAWWPAHIPWPPMTTNNLGEPMFDTDAYVSIARLHGPGGTLSNSASGLPEFLYRTPQEAQAVIDSNPSLSGYRITQSPSTGLWSIEPGPATADNIARSVEQLITQELAKGNWEAALALDDFRKRPSQLELFDRALALSRSPGDYFALSNMLRGSGPLSEVPRSFVFDIFGNQVAAQSPADILLGRQQRASAGFAGDTQDMMEMLERGRSATPPAPPGVPGADNVRGVPSGPGTPEEVARQAFFDALAAGHDEESADRLSIAAFEQARAAQANAPAAAPVSLRDAAQAMADSLSFQQERAARPARGRSAAAPQAAFLADIQGGRPINAPRDISAIPGVGPLPTERSFRNLNPSEREMFLASLETKGISREDAVANLERQFNRLGGARRPSGTTRLASVGRMGV